MSYIKGKSFKIVSRFYVIYGDYEPIYVGYTNRTVKQRFREHQKDKDFSEYENVEVKELTGEKLSFDFTWDYEQTCKNADEVSLREGQLVQKYGTQDSVFQKADGGGQTWATEKWFVKSNRNNHKFDGRSGLEINKALKEEKVISTWLNGFVRYIEPVEEVWLSSFVGNINPVEEVWLNSFVSNMKPMEEVWLNNFINNMKPKEETWLQSFMSNMKPDEERWLSDFVSHINPKEEHWLNNFVQHIKPKEEVWLNGFVSTMRPTEETWINSFVSHMQHIEEVWINNFIAHMKI